MKTRFFSCLPAFLIIVFAFSASASERDGSWWRQLSYEQKQVWVIGWMDGNAAGARILGARTETQSSKLYQQILIDLDMRSDQIVQGMDRFYAGDFRNLRIPAMEVPLLVAFYVRGAPPAEIKDFADYLRSAYH
jgi:hypothetical protein